MTLADDHLESEVRELKYFLRALIADGTSYAEIADATGIDANTLKQFVHRKALNPRKTPIFYKLLRFVRELDRNRIGKIYSNEPSLKRAINSWVSHGNDSSSEYDSATEFQKRLADPISFGTELPDVLSPTYFMYRMASRPNAVIKSKITVRNGAHGIQFDHDRNLNNDSRTTGGVIVLNNVSIFFIGTSLNNMDQEIMAFKRPSLVPDPDEHKYFESPRERKKYYTILVGIVLALDSHARPTAARTLLIPAHHLRSQNIGLYTIEQLKLEELSPVASHDPVKVRTSPTERVINELEIILKGQIAPAELVFERSG